MALLPIAGLISGAIGIPAKQPWAIPIPRRTIERVLQMELEFKDMVTFM